jgi:O-antigen/teichoic acid export membrane protein
VGTALAGLGAILQTFQNTLAVQLMVDLRLGWVTILELVRQLVLVIGIVVLVLLDAELAAFLALLIPASLVSVALTVWLVRGQVPMRPAFDWSEWRVLIRDVLPFAAIVLVTLVYFRVALILLSLVSTPRETGYYGAAFRITEVLITVPQLAVVSAFPIFVRAARDDSQRLAYGVGRMFHAMIVLGVAMALALVLGASFVIDVIAGPGFEPAAGVLRIQAVTLVAVFVVVTFNYVFLSLRLHRTMLLITGGALVLNAVGAGILGAAHGARGAALATMVADLIAAVAGGVALRNAGLPVGRWLRVVPRVALAAVPAGAVWFVPIGALPKAAIGVAVYGIGLIVLRAIPEELLVEARRLRRKTA